MQKGSPRCQGYTKPESFVTRMYLAFDPDCCPGADHDSYLCRRHDPGALDGSLAAAGGRGTRPLINGTAAAHAADEWHGSAGRSPAGSSPGGSASARAEPGAVRIAVDDPVKKAEAGLIPGYSSGYVLYRVATVSKLPSYRSERASVRRRFRDFVVRRAVILPYELAADNALPRVTLQTRIVLRSQGLTASSTARSECGMRGVTD